MNVHNTMEEVVGEIVNGLYDQIKASGASWLTCDCENCRLDATSYVLNRVPPRYVVSGRGVEYAKQVWDNKQLIADISALALEGVRTISSTKRAYHTLPHEALEVTQKGLSAFNFPTFSGTVLDGSTFEPIAGATVMLKCDGKVCEMADRTWNNPVTTFEATKGAFTFWVRSVPAEKDGVNRKFTFQLEISASGHDAVTRSFEVPVVSESRGYVGLNTVYTVKVPDTLLFRSEEPKKPAEAS